MADIKESLTGKLGPLPVYAWALIVSVPIIGGKLLLDRRKAAAAAASAAAAAADQGGDASSIPDGSVLPVTANAGGVAAGALYPAGNPGGVYESGGDSYEQGTTSAGPANNYAWTNAAADKLVAQGYESSTVLSALRKVIEGQPVTEAEEALYNTAVRAQGASPPDGIPSISRASTTGGAADTPQNASGPPPISPATENPVIPADQQAAQAAYNAVQPGQAGYSPDAYEQARQQLAAAGGVPM